MADARVFYALLAAADHSVAAAGELSRRLTEVGAHELPAESSRRESPDVPTLVVGDHVTEGLIDAVVSCAAGGRRRVVVVLDDVGRSEDRWRVLASGASDVLPMEPESVAEEVAARLGRWRAVDDLLDSPEVRAEVVGASPVWRAVLSRVVEVARFTTSSLLVTGETGTGKELIARLFHHLDPRTRKGDLVVLDCTTVVPTLAGSEFFGHEKGAFTGAVNAREGAFAAANGGTLFLDEVGELPMSLQTELLRVVQEGTYKRVGSNVWNRTDFRLVCATNRDLDAEMDEHGFRRDLYYRIAANLVRLPPLGERRDDVLPLFRHFLSGAMPGAVSLDDAVVRWIQQRDYPGNVRDLKQLAARIAARHVGPGPVTPGDVPEEERPRPSDVLTGRRQLLERAVQAALDDERTLQEIKQEAADTAIRLAIADCRTRRAAAQRLGVTERALQLRRKGEAGNGAGKLEGSGVPQGGSSSSRG